MLESLVNIKNVVSDLYINDISDMTCQLHNLHLE